MRMELQFGKMKRALEMGGGWRLPNDVHILNAIELYT